MQLYVFAPVQAGQKGKGPMVEFVQTRENAKLVSEEPTGTIYTNFDVAQAEVGKKNLALYRQQQAKQ